ncbi:MAG: glycosyltransferase family 39 protein [Caldilineaceae bacterium]
MGWFGLAQSDAGLRLFGALLGVVTVWAIVRLATAMSGRTVGLVTGILVALSPLLTWYSQELRMFQPATTGLTVGALCLWRAWTAPNRTRQYLWWAGYLVATTAALYSYLFSAFLLPAAGLMLLLLPWQAPQPQRWSRVFTGIVAIGGTGLLFLPLAYNAWLVNSSEGDPGVAFADLGTNLWHLLRIFTIWRVPWPTAYVWSVLAFFALLTVGGLLLPARRAEQQPTRSWLLLWIGIPLLIGNVLQSRSASVFGEDRYFLFLVPFVLWATARGLVLLGAYWRPLGWLATVSAVGIMAAALTNLWTPAMYREQWRAAATYIADYHESSPGLPDTVVAHVDYTHLPLEWYLRKRFPFEELPLYYPYGGTLTPEQIDTVIGPPLQGIVETGAATLWLTQSHLDGVDDGHLVEGWLQARYPLVTELYPAGIKLSGFALQSQFEQLPALAANAITPAATLVPGLALAACEVMTPVVSARDEIMHPPSGWVHVRLWWRATGSIDDDYIATAEVVGPEGAWGVRLYRENEALRRWPTSSWPPDLLVRDEIDINLNPVTPARTFPIFIGLMDSSGQPAGARTECGTVVVN